MKDYAVLSHSGHGVNSYAIQYYLVQGSLCIFLHLGWGGVYMDRAEAAATIRDCFTRADQITSLAQTVRLLQAGERLTIVGSDFYGSYWIPPGGSRRGEVEGPTGPLKVLTKALDWLRRYRRAKSDATRKSTVNITAKAKGVLREHFSGVADGKGYAQSPRENLLPDIDWAPIERDLR